MKIIQVIGNLRGGGAERVALRLHHSFLTLGHQSQLWLTEADKNAYHKQHEVYCVPPSELIEKLQKNNPALILAHMENTAAYLQEIKTSPSLYFIVHTALLERLGRKSFFSRIRSRKKLIQLYENANIVAVSKGIIHDITQKLQIKPASICHIPNPFDIAEIQSQANEPLQTNLDALYLIGIGSLNSVKRHDIMLKAFAQLPDHLELVLLGEGRKRAALEKLAHRLGISQRVHFKGWVQNPYTWIKQAKLLLHSSEAEGLPNVLIESLILQTPVVSTDCNHGPREIMTDELAAYLAKVNDPHDLAEKAKRALANYPEVTPEYYRRFDAQSVAKAYCALTNAQS